MTAKNSCFAGHKTAKVLVSVLLFCVGLMFSPEGVAKPRFSLGGSFGYGVLLHDYRGEGTLSQQFELAAFGKVRVHRFFALRALVGFQTTTGFGVSSGVGTKPLFSGGVELHVTKSDFIFDPYIFANGGYPRMWDAGLGFQINPGENVSVFLEAYLGAQDVSVRGYTNLSTVKDKGGALGGRLGLLWRF